MAVLHEHLFPAFPQGWRYTRFRLPAFPPRWHVHPEFELTLMTQGHGTRLIGDSVEEYRPGDLVLIGPGLAHTYASVDDGGVHEAVVIHFARDFLGDGFFELPVFAVIGSMLDRASLGLRFTQPPTVLWHMDDLGPAERTVALLEALVELSRQAAVSLATGQAAIEVSSGTASRVEAMVAFAHAHFDGDISAKEVADAAFMNLSAASRLFARSTGMTITRYVNVLRVNAACRMLRETDLPVATIAGDSGFSNLSNFNRRFREIKQSTPREYRAMFRAGLPELKPLDGEWTIRAKDLERAGITWGAQSN